MLFYDHFHHEKCPKVTVSLVSELKNYNTRTNLRRFSPSLIGCFLWNNTRLNSSGTN